MNELYLYDSEYISQYGAICGIDEAGRGPLAGPVCAGCAMLCADDELPFLNDSKKLTPLRRAKLYEQLTAGGAYYGIGWASPREIDEVNILQATFLAMGRAYADMLSRFPEARPALALVDGNRMPPLPLNAKTVIGGDGRSASIAAASVLAKVSRDRLMEEYAKEYPQYRFEQHKGYPTKLHYEMIERFGISELHRRSFLKGIGDGRDG